MAKSTKSKDSGSIEVNKKITSVKPKPSSTSVRKRAPKSQDYDKDFELICVAIENGKALRQVCKKYMSTKKFYELLDSSEEKKKRYARACGERAEFIVDEILQIADKKNADVKIVKGRAIVDGEAIQRSKLKIETRKWLAAKLNPKKYGEKIDVDHTSNGETIAPTPIVFTRGSNEK